MYQEPTLLGGKALFKSEGKGKTIESIASGGWGEGGEGATNLSKKELVANFLGLHLRSRKRHRRSLSAYLLCNLLFWLFKILEAASFPTLVPWYIGEFLFEVKDCVFRHFSLFSLFFPRPFEGEESGGGGLKYGAIIVSWTDDLADPKLFFCSWRSLIPKLERDFLFLLFSWDLTAAVASHFPDNNYVH